ncbi:hypothetical protein B0H13DRAFT_1853441 [Mycena leptocephala]|nr:hypothetical protein B0H13DRAFT_1853441 [Mycena leptocephala]
MSSVRAGKPVQAILDRVYPGNKLAVDWGDKICSRTASRIRERRSLIAQTALSAVDASFDTTEYRQLLFVPTPESCPPNPKAAGYICSQPGIDYLESPLMIITVTPFFKNEEYTVPDAKPDGVVQSKAYKRSTPGWNMAGCLEGVGSADGGASGVEDGRRRYTLLRCTWNVPWGWWLTSECVGAMTKGPTGNLKPRVA